MAENQKGFVPYFLKAKMESACEFAYSFLLLRGGSQRRVTALLGRKNPKKPAVSWQGIQRGQRPLGTRLCSQSLVCYTFVKGLAADGLFCPNGWGKRRLERAEIAERLQRKAAAWASTGAKGYRSRCASLPAHN